MTGSLRAAAAPFGSYAAGVFQLAIKQGFYVSFWRELDPKAGRFRVNCRLGNDNGPFPRFALDFPLDTSIEEATERVARQAWDYFTTTGYRPPSEGITPQDVARTPRRLIIDIEAERQARHAESIKRRRPLERR